MEKMWQKAPNHVWFTSEKMTCDICGRKPHKALEVKNVGGGTSKICFDLNRPCFNSAFHNPKFVHDGDNLFMRMVEYEPVIKPGEAVKREPIGLSLRFNVMERDFFSCVICGTTARDSKLEIDHIHPVALGGETTMKNLQTLCFNCNRGKSAKAPKKGGVR
jgi:hypothetical protein